MTDEVRYLYSVNPKKPIRGLSEVPAVLNPKSLYLTIDDVRKCLECGTVYRRFANGNRLEQVTGRNIERMHQAVFMDEAEFEKFKNDQLGSSVGKVEVAAPEPVKVEEPVTEPEPEKIEEPVIEEAPVVEEVAEEVAPEETEEEAVEDSDDANKIDYTPNYNKKKKNRN